MSALRVLLVDPSLFTAPYDAALHGGLLALGVEPTWAVRPSRAAEPSELPERHVEPFFYRWIERQAWLTGRPRAAAKGLAHALGLARLLLRVARRRPDIVHFQWTVVPLLDSVAMALIRPFSKVVLTVHDTVPFNGERLSLLQNLGFDLPVRLSHRVIVHTQAGRARLLARGARPERVAVIAHGPLSLKVTPREPTVTDGRYCFVVFGELKPYKGIDVVVEALCLLPQAVRERCLCIVAGRPRMDLSPLLERIAAASLCSSIEVWPRRLSEQEMAELFAVADCFLFPYRQIDASGVYFLVKGLGKWLIASRIGIFAEDVREGEQGALVPSGDAAALATALSRAALERPQPKLCAQGAAWTAIARQTVELYEGALAGAALPQTRAPETP